MKKRAIRITLVVVGAAGCALAIAVGVSAVISSKWADVASAFATLLSIVLAVASILYTYQTNQKTEDLLSKIENQSLGMMDRINSELRKGNFGRQNIENLDKKFASERSKDDVDRNTSPG